MDSRHIEARGSQTNAPHTVRDEASAAAAARLPRGSRVRLDVPGLDAGIAARFEARINASLGECGCQASAAFLAVAVCAAAAFDALQWTLVRSAPATAIAVELGLVFLACSLGRFAGIAHARLTLRRLLSAVCHRIDAVVAKETSWAA